MASRQEEKERRREERIAREKAASEAAQRKRLAQIVGGVVVAAAIVVGIAISVGGGGGSSGRESLAIPLVPIPARSVTNLETAAKAADCTLTSPPIEGRTHVTGSVTYKTNPPTSGDHYPIPASDRNYAGRTTPVKEHYVHALEHGRIEIQYKPGLSRRRIGQLESLFYESSKTDFGLESTNGSYTLLFANNTKMPYEVAAAAWGQLLACKTFNDKVFDAIRAFRERYTLRGPEKILDPE